MTQQIITLSERRGGQLFDPVTSSSYQQPSAYLADLSGCGIDTHFAFSDSFNMNARVECEAPVTGLQWSKSGYISFGQPVANNLTTWTGTVLNAEFNVNDSDLVGFAMASDSVASAQLVALLNTTFPVAAGIGNNPAPDWESRGANFVLRSTGRSRRLIAQISKPQSYIVRDNCGIAIGRKYQISASVQGFDLTTCKPALLWQSSLTFMAGFELYGLTPTAAVVDPDLITLGAYAVPATIPPAGNVEPQTAADTQWLTYTPAPRTIGTAAL